MIISDEEDKQSAIAKIGNLNLEKIWRVDVSEYKCNRSKAQNRLLWIWLTIWGDDLGYTKEEMYDVAVHFCWPLPEQELICNGKQVSRQRRTSQLNTKTFSEFLDHIDRKAAQQGTLLPRPEDMYFEAMGLKREKPCSK